MFYLFIYLFVYVRIYYGFFVSSWLVLAPVEVNAQFNITEGFCVSPHRRATQIADSEMKKKD